MHRSSPKGVMNLHTLSRKELQLLAKQEGIKANLKTEDIRQRLLQKYPREYPRATNSPELKSEKPEATTDQIRRDTTVEPPQNVHGQNNDVESPDVPDDMYFIEPSTPTRTSIDREYRSFVFRLETPEPFVMPTKKDLRFVRRELATLANERNGLHDEIEDSDRVLQTALSEIDSITRGADELAWMRVGMEVFINRKMKEDRTVWDGTAFMSRQSQKKWRSWLEEDRTRRENAIPGVYAPSIFDNDPPFVLLHIAS